MVIHLAEIPGNCPLGDIENDDRNYYQTINAIEAMNITEEDIKYYLV